MDLKATQQWFFTSDKVKDLIDPAVRKALAKFGAFVRQRAKTSIKTRAGTSRPGRPPFSHTGTLKKFIYFSYDPARKSVVIGPTLAGPMSGAPAALEHGGAGVRPRPFMGPAFAAEAAADQFKDLIR